MALFDRLRVHVMYIVGIAVAGSVTDFRGVYQCPFSVVSTHTHTHTHTCVCVCFNTVLRLNPVAITRDAFSQCVGSSLSQKVT